MPHVTQALYAVIAQTSLHQLATPMSFPTLFPPVILLQTACTLQVHRTTTHGKLFPCVEMTCGVKSRMRVRRHPWKMKRFSPARLINLLSQFSDCSFDVRYTEMTRRKVREGDTGSCIENLPPPCLQHDASPPSLPSMILPKSKSLSRPVRSPAQSPQPP